MATRFVRVDLSDDARDYRPIAVEPGVPMLDRSGSNVKILFRWLGGMAADPAWDGDSVSFYVQDDQGGRLEEVVCQPASDSELRTLLKDQVDKLRQRIEQARAETPTERVLRRVLLQSFQSLVDNPNRTDLDSYFYKYRDINGMWRLVWCWGFQRVDQEPAPAVVCTDPECNLLFVRRAGQSPKCPDCEAVWSFRPLRKTNWKVTGLAALVLLLLAALLGWWALRPSRLIVTPSTFKGPVGSRVEFQVSRAGLFSRKDVTREAIGVTYDPQVARFNQATGTATLISSGTTLVRFQWESLSTEVAVAAEPGDNPAKLTIEPRTADVAVGTTARFKLIGETVSGERVDLTDSAQWKPMNDGILYSSGGLVEGLAKGSTQIVARYRATPESPFMEATAAVNVEKVEFKSLEVGVEPSNIADGMTGKIRVDAVGADDTRYSVLDSSQLWFNVEPSHVASIAGSFLRAERSGRGNLKAWFGPQLSGEASFSVGSPPSIKPEIHPDRSLDLVVGQIADINVISPSREPVRMTSATPNVVAFSAGNRIIGRSPGVTEVTIAQGGREIGRIEVTVTTADFSSIEIDPGSLAVAVDETIQPRVYATVDGSDPPRRVEIARNYVMCDKSPSPRYAEFNNRLSELRGIAPTSPSAPQSLSLRLGALQATAPVDVVIAPCRLDVTPAGPIDLPLGQMMRLQAWATYTGGRRIQVPAERCKWAADEKAVSGLKLYGDRIGALQAGAGPMSVFASYLGRESNRVIFKSTEADPNVQLALEVDRTLRLSGERGQAILAATSPAGDIELVPEMASFKSADAKTIKIDEKAGSLVAGTPGEATISASHAAAKSPASLSLRVGDPAKARLVFDPPSVRVGVNEQVPLRLTLEVEDGGKTYRAPMENAGVGYFIARPEAVRWSPPTLTGLEAAKPFEIRAGYFPVLTRTASAQVEVVGAEAGSLRVTPSSVALAPGQAIALTVERKQEDSDQWKEVRPDGVDWRVPPGAIWTPGTERHRAMVAIPADATGELTLVASVAGSEATSKITVKSNGPDAKDPAARLVVAREPGGKYLPVGQSQRYNILVEKDGQAEPAAEIKWPENFENDFVRWEAPVLTAKKENYTQWLRVDVGGRTALIRTTTCAPGTYEKGPEDAQANPQAIVNAPPPRTDQPVAVKILSDQGQQVRFPAGAAFDDFRIEAHYADGFTRLVTKKATMRVHEPGSAAVVAPSDAVVSPSGGKLLGVRTGTAEISAEFDGVKSTVPLKVEVLGSVDVDKLVIEPAPLMMRPGESFPLRAIGYKDGKQIGDITGLGKIEWQSDKPDVARLSGPSVTGANLGTAKVTARLGAISSAPASIVVTDSIADALKIDPKMIVMRVGESLRIGPDVQVYRGDLDVSGQCNVVPELPGVVRFDPENRSLIAEREGKVPVSIAMGDKIQRTMVEVLPGGVKIDGDVLVEPSNIVLAPGLAQPVRVYVVTPDGDRIDRTASAIFRSSDESKVTVQGDRVCALAPGKVELKVAVSGAQKGAAASVEVRNEAIEELIVEPKELWLSTGDRGYIQIMGRAPCGVHELFPQPELKTAPRKQGIVAVNGMDQILGLSPGEDVLDVTYRNLKAETTVKVANNPYTDLRIEPTPRTIRVGDALPYQVTAMRGGQRQVLTPEQGVQLLVGDPAKAQVLQGLTVVGTGPGRTTVAAQLGNQRAEAVLDVTPRDAIVDNTGGVDVIDPLRIIDAGGDIIDRRTIIDDDGHVRIIGRGDVIPDGYHLIDGSTAGTVVGPVAGLAFRPDRLLMGTNAQPMLVRVFEVDAAGRTGREVTTDPNLELSQPSDVAQLEKKAEGPFIRGIKDGQTRLNAKLGDLASAAPLLIDIGGDSVIGGTLEVSPNPLVVWSGEATKFGSVLLNPGGGQNPFPVEYKVTAAPGQGMVTVDEQNTIHGASIGTSQLTVTPTDPRYQGLSAPVPVQVIAAEDLRIDPPELTLQVGQSTGPISVTTRGPDGAPMAVQALVKSLDENVLAPSSDAPGGFVGKSMGQTKIIGSYRGREASATVSVSGARFASVNTTMNNEGKKEFDVSIEVLAAGTEGELEYRVYREGETPQENWVPNQPEGDSRKVTLRSPPMPTGQIGELYHLVLEARDKAGKSVQKYPLTLQSGITIHQLKQNP